jgi:hypothetical protein
VSGARSIADVLRDKADKAEARARRLLQEADVLRSAAHALDHPPSPRGVVIETAPLPRTAAAATVSGEETPKRKNRPPKLAGSTSVRIALLMRQWQRWVFSAEIADALVMDHREVSTVLSHMVRRKALVKRLIPENVIPHDGRAMYQFAHPSMLTERAKVGVGVAR